MSEEAKAVVRRFIEESWVEGNLALIDEIFSPDLVDHDFKPALGPGRQGVKNTLMMFRNALPDLTAEIDLLFADGEYVVSRVRFRGTQGGPIFGVQPTHRKAVVSQLAVYRFEGGKIVELWHNADALGFLHQLGALPTPGPPPGVKPPAAS